jgi:hypothetical protein
MSSEFSHPRIDSIATVHQSSTKSASKCISYLIEFPALQFNLELPPAKLLIPTPSSMNDSLNDVKFAMLPSQKAISKRQKSNKLR